MSVPRPAVAREARGGPGSPAPNTSLLRFLMVVGNAMVPNVSVLCRTVQNSEHTQQTVQNAARTPNTSEYAVQVPNTKNNTRFPNIEQCYLAALVTW